MSTLANSMAKRPPVKRGRPSAKQAALLDRVILDTARVKFLSEGYDAVALEAVAAESGVSKGTLYARHKSKEALFLAVWQDRVKQWSYASSQQDHLLTDDIHERLRHHARTITRSLLDSETRAFQRLIMGSGERFASIRREIHELGYQYIAGLIARDIAAAAKRDGIPAKDEAAAADALVAMITGWMLQICAIRDVTEKEALGFCDTATDIFFAGRSAW